MVFSKAPGTPRNASWRAASGKSRLRAIWSSPASLRRATRLGVSASVAAGMVAVRRPQALPSAMSSKRSGRLTGSPPVNTMSGVPISAV
jgi:hypothetical protein